MAQDLVQFLTETAHETAARAQAASATTRGEMIREVEELMALRTRLLARLTDSDHANQLQLPLEIKAAA